MPAPRRRPTIVADARWRLIEDASMKSVLPGLLCLGILTACSLSKQPAGSGLASATTATAPSAPSAPVSGIDLKGMDTTVRAQDDFYQYVNGNWLKTTEIPADKPAYGAFTALYDLSQDRLKSLIEGIKTTPDDANQQKIATLYSSFMNEAAIEDLGAKPLDEETRKIDAVTGVAGFGPLFAHYNAIGVGVPFDVSVHLDNKDSSKYVIDFSQSGLGLPDRDYYLGSDAKLKEILGKYQAHVEKMLMLGGDSAAKADAAKIVALETALAKLQWDKVKNRDPIAVYNKVEIAKLPTLAPGFDWAGYLSTAGVTGKTDYVIVSQPSYLTGFAKLLTTTPLDTWKTYFRWHLLHSYSPFLSKAFVDENFAFYGTALRGTPENRVRWKRGVGMVENAMGEALGQMYVAKYFPPEDKARVQALVQNLLAAFKQSIDTLDWMGPETKQAAQAKLAKFTPKIAYPDKWRDYSKLQVVNGEVVGNAMRASEFEFNRNINKLGQPVDRSEWGMTPQTINAYYNPEMNEIVFPAAILQPPFFDPKADDAVNYGAIGAVIGHEISHGFDDQGAQYDGDGNLHDWWTKADHGKFAAKTAALVSEYGKFEPVKGFHLNGKLTLGENIADNSGLAIAYKAYHIALAGKPAPVIDGMTGDQRFFAGFAQVWREKLRDNYAIELIKSDPHSIPINRVMGTVVNQPAFYDAFSVKPGDKMYVAPDKRVLMW
jgi:putative endopeptidase